MGRGQGDREPLQLAALDVSATPTAKYPVVEVAFRGKVGVAVIFKDLNDKYLSCHLFALDFINTGYKLNPTHASYYAVCDPAPASITTLDFCTCGALNCIHLQAVQAAQAEAASENQWQWRIRAAQPLNAHSLASGAAWYDTGWAKLLVGYALRVGKNQGVLALDMWSHAYSNPPVTSLRALTHELSGICQVCKVSCVEGQLLKTILGDAPAIWDETLLRRPSLRVEARPKALYVDGAPRPKELYIEGAFGEYFSYRVGAITGSDHREYQLTAYLGSDLASEKIDFITEEIYQDGRFTSTSDRCVSVNCVHAPWRAFYEKRSNSVLSRLRLRFL